VIVLIVSVAVLGVCNVRFHRQRVVALVGLGVILVRGLRGGARWWTSLWLSPVASSIAGYTMRDKEGVRYADPVTYVTLILVVPAIVSVLYVASRGGWMRVVPRSSVTPGEHWIGTGDGVRAGTRGAHPGIPAASVAAVRQVSVVIAVALGAILLHEKVGPSRVAGAIV
jgi:drug/metabolite transporter (DMT)-like permease